MKKLAFVLLISLFVLSGRLSAQNTGSGILPFGSYTQAGFDTINNQNLNVYFTLPLVSSAGRGMPFQFALTNNSLIWQNSGTAWQVALDSFGWHTDYPPGGTISFSTSTVNRKCPGTTQIYPVTTYKNYVYTDIFGTPHSFPINFQDSACDALVSGTFSGYARDHSGYFAADSGGDPSVFSNGGVNEINGRNIAEDVNGNYVGITVVNSTETDWTDSVGNIALKIFHNTTATPPNITYEFLDGNGNYQSIVLVLQSLNIKTNFACSGVTEYTGTSGFLMPVELDIPSPTSGVTLKYFFTYEGTPGNPGFVTGRIQKVKLPTGGSYEWDYTGSNDGINCSDGTTLGLNRVVSDGTNSGTWSYVRSGSTTTVTTPSLPDAPANAIMYTYDTIGRETSRKIYPGTSVNGTPLRTINTTYATNFTPATQITILEDGSTQSEIDTTYDSNGLLDSTSEYDFGSGLRGNLLRTTTYTYVTSSSYTNKNLLTLVSSKVIKDGTGVVQYRQDTTYDGVALASCPTGAAHHDDSSFPCTSNVRGNPTAVTTYTSPATPSGGITKNFTYDWFGNLLTAQLNCCTQKTWTYSATTQFSQPDSVTSGTSPNQLTTNYTYNPSLLLLATSTDSNNLVTTYTYDFLRRPTQISQANGSTSGKIISYTYDDVHFTTTTKTSIDSTKSVKQVTFVNGLRQVILSTIEDANSNIVSNVSTNHDVAGRAYQTSNPYTGTASYFTTTQFDVLGRPKTVSLPDTSTTSYDYAEQYTTVTDPAGKKRNYQVDGVGRLVAVTEPDNTGNLVNATHYTYNVIDELLKAADAQTSPTQTRTNSYDALGRLVSTVTPEGGQTCFGSQTGTTCNQDGYDNFDNLLTRTDARGVVTSYTYDGLNRLKGVSYNVGSTGVPATGPVSLTYGTNASQFNNGALISMTDGVGSENYSYNALEQLTQLQKVINGSTFTTNYQYNIAGELTQITYPSGRAIQQSVDAVGRLCEIAPSTTGCGTAASPYATGYDYNVASQTTGFKYGNGIYASLGFSPDRLQLTCLDYSTTNRNGTCAHDSTTKFGLNYSYGTTGNNNSLIAGITDSVDNGRSVAYTYDPLSRLSTAVTTGSANYPQWGLSWGYDRYGNRLNQTLTTGSGYQGSITVNPQTNHITTAGTYDANGNMTNDGTNTLVYDAENRAVSATNQSASGTYTYDGNGHRVKKVSGGTTTVYIFSGSKVIAEYDNGAAVGSPSREYIYGGGALLAKIDSSGTKYYHRDHLSNRLVTDSSGNIAEQMGHYPFGDPWYNASNDKLVFTSYERDSESSNDYAMARYYRWLLGRFLALDPLSGSTSDPQSLNRYTYVENNPINFVDPSGMDEDEVCGCGGGGGGGFGGSFSFMGGDSFAGPGGDTGLGNVNGLGDGQPSQGDTTVIVTVSPIDIGTSDLSILGSPSFQQGPGSGGGGIRVKIPPPPPPPGYKECIKAALREMIAHDEGTGSQPNNGYGSLVQGTVVSSPVPFEDLTGETFGGRSGFAPYNLPNPSALQGHPNILVRVNGLGSLSTAFGRYQIVVGTAANLGPGGTPWTDWSPSGQDAAANVLMDRKGMIDDAMSGQIVQAIWDGNGTWASLPDSPYNQNPKSWAETIGAFQQALTSLPKCK